MNINQWQIMEKPMLEVNRFEHIHHPNLKEEEEEHCCDNPDPIISEDGIRVCRNCGLTFGQEMVCHERRAYTAEEIRSRQRTEPRWRSFGPRTVITRVKNDARGRLLPAKKQAFFSRLSKIQGSLINSIERNYWEAKPKLQTLANKLSIPDFIVETAWKIYCEVARQKLTMGRSIEDFVCASLYAAIRIYNFSRLLEELTEVANVPPRSVHRALGLLLRNVLPVLNLKYRPINPEPLVFRFGNELNLSMAVQKNAVQLLITASKHGLRRMGQDPKGLAAAALYVAAKGTNEHKTQNQIAGVARVTEVTLRTHAKQIQDLCG
ncbi:MAG: transcription initiation factor IIB [Promethearchaeota archaeon CR_4]|nr:MAG: transcription initiation factor IIB [Candidatus Lokiarchaeota archaeon CR_4]